MQWLALDVSHRRAVAHDAQRLAAVGSGLSTSQSARLKAGVFEARGQDLRCVLRVAQGRTEQPRASIFDSRTRQSSPESGQRAGYDGAKLYLGSQMHMAVDTLGNLLALHVTAANEQDRAQVGQLAQAVQQETGQSVEVAFVNQGYTGDEAQQAAASRAFG